MKKKFWTLAVSFAATGGVCLLFAVMPSVFFDYVSSAEMEALKQFPADQLNPLLANLREVRESIFTADAWRSLAVIVLGTVMLMLYRAKSVNKNVMVAVLVALCLVDMWTVNKRYLNDSMFVPKSVKEQPQQLTATDEQILKDKALDYRVLNFASNTFNENETSFYHKSVGGYHAAKLRRYQEMIEAYIQPQMQATISALADAKLDFSRIAGDSIFPVINMLNTKYFILPMQEGQTAPVENPYAMGNAWFVDNVEYAANANEEIDKVGKINLRKTAVADNQFKNVLGTSTPQDSTSTVEITAYQPNNLKYTAESKNGGVLVFSEIYYPGWTATVDGAPVEIGRVDYILRAINLKPGKHEVVLDFHPQSVKKTEGVAYAAGGLLLLLILAGGFLEWRKSNNTKTDDKA